MQFESELDAKIEWLEKKRTQAMDTLQEIDHVNSAADDRINRRLDKIEFALNILDELKNEIHRF